MNGPRGIASGLVSLVFLAVAVWLVYFVIETARTIHVWPW